MPAEYSVSLQKIIDAHGLEIMYLPCDAKDILITTSEVNRPGIVLTGYVDYFDPLRIQILGWTELGFLQNMEREEQEKALGYWLSLKPAAAVITRGLEVPQYFLNCCEKYGVPLLKTSDETSPFLAALIQFLNTSLAPRITRHGVLCEVYGEGVLIMGESGIGKSEAAIELIKRGHRLVTDDVVELRRVSEDTLIGSAPDITKHFIELRGIGIVDVKALFGASSVRDTQNIDLVIRLEDWDKDKEYDRLGLEEEYTEYLGNKVVCHNIPIRPGRNLAIICESAAVNHRQKKMGYNAAQELYTRVQNSLARRRDEDDE